MLEFEIMRPIRIADDLDNNASLNEMREQRLLRLAAKHQSPLIRTCCEETIPKSPLEWTDRERAEFLAQEEAREFAQLEGHGAEDLFESDLSMRQSDNGISQPISMPSDDNLPPPGWWRQWDHRDDDTQVLTSHHHRVHHGADAAA